MKTNHLLLIVVLFLSLFLAGCGDNDSASVSGTLPGGGTDTAGIVDTPVADTPTDTPTPVSAIQLTTTASTISSNSAATITVVLFNASGQVIGTPKDVAFTLSNPVLGSIPGSVAVSGGSTNQLFTARSSEGDVVITAKADNVTETVAIEISNQTSAADILLDADRVDISYGETSSVFATVTDASNNPVPSGTKVDFTVAANGTGTIFPSATTDASGVAQATFTASNTSGTATITATSGSVSNSTQIFVTAPDVASGSIEFSSADPQVIVMQGSGGQETSTVKFLVKDSSGTPITSSKTVQLELSGPNGGEYLGNDSLATTINVSTVNGFAQAILHSGTVPGPVTVTATVLDTDLNPTDLSTSSGVIAIGGGIPSAGHFSLSADRLNIEGLAYDNITDNILALIADRYGNYNVLKGTSVSYYSECGAVDRAVALDEIGQGSVTFRTQSPDPQDVDADTFVPFDRLTPPAPPVSGSCGGYCAVENWWAYNFYRYLGVDITSGSNNPRDGLCTIVAVVDGEEEFTDNNANGVYDKEVVDGGPEPYVDTYDDVHLDMDDDPIDVPFGDEIAGYPYDAVFGTQLGEDLVVDRNGSGSFNGMNDEWDENKRITRRINLLYTGQPGLTLSDSSFDVPNGGSQTIYFSLHDANYNRPIGGTTLDVKFSGTGTVTGTTKVTFLDSSAMGSPIYAVTISDSNPASTRSTAASLEFSWTWLGSPFGFVIGGTTE